MTIIFLSLPQPGVVLSQYLRCNIALAQSNIERSESRKKDRPPMF